MVKFLLERIAPVHIDTESIRYFVPVCEMKGKQLSHFDPKTTTNTTDMCFSCTLFDRFLSLSLSSCISALIKQVNKSIDGTADDEEEGVPTEEAIRAGLELLKVKTY